MAAPPDWLNSEEYILTQEKLNEAMRKKRTILDDDISERFLRSIKELAEKKRNQSKFYTTTDRRGEYGDIMGWNECRVRVDDKYTIKCKIHGIKKFQYAVS